MMKESKVIAEKLAARELSFPETSNFWFKQSLRFIKKEPTKYLKLLARKFTLFWDVRERCDIDDYYFLRKKFPTLLNLPLFSFGIIAPLGIIGMILSARLGKKMLILYLFILSNMLSIIFYFITSRYRLLIVPVLIIFATYGLYEIYLRLKNKRYQQLSFLSAGLLVFFILINKGIFESSKAEAFDTSYYNLGILYRQQGDHEAAIDEYKKAIEINPKYWKAYNELGTAYLNTGLTTQALSIFRKSIQIYPSPEAYNNIGFIYYGIGDVKKSIESYEQAIEIDSEFAMTYSSLGFIYFKQGLLDKAEATLKKAIEINEAYARPYYNLGLVSLAKSDEDGAVKYFEEYLKREKNATDIEKVRREIERLKRE